MNTAHDLGAAQLRKSPYSNGDGGDCIKAGDFPTA
jgi:hypothetical protein